MRVIRTPRRSIKRSLGPGVPKALDICVELRLLDMDAYAESSAQTYILNYSKKEQYEMGFLDYATGSICNLRNGG